MKIRMLILALLFMTPLLAVSVEARDPYKYFFSDSFGNFAEEAQSAKSEGRKGVLIFFEMDECPFCHYMKNNVLNRPEVQEYYRKHFSNFSVNIEGDMEITNFHGKSMLQKDFAFKENRVRATPVIAFYDLEGNEIFRHTGRTSGVEEFMLMGRYVAEGIYKKMPFTRFKREQRK